MPPFNTIDVHPPSHSPSSLPTLTYDVICIGSGWAPRVMAGRLVKAGLSALIIESELVGGECPFWACVPSKALLRSSEALHEAQAVSGAGFSTNKTTLDAEGVFARRDAFTAGWDDSRLLVPMVENTGTAIVRGWGRIVGTKMVRVENVNGETAELQARHAVAVCTGSIATMPDDIPGLKESDPWGPRQATSQSEVPKHLLVIGAGAVGTEMTTAYASLGSKVTLVAKSTELLPRFDPEVGKLLREALTKRGVDVHTSTSVTAVRRSSASVGTAGTGPFTVDLTNGTSVTGVTKILAATGRKAATQGIGLGALGLKTDGSPIPVDDSLLVASVEGQWLYAVGDINMRGPFSHSSKYHGRIAASAILARAGRGDKSATGEFGSPWSPVSATADVEALPQVVFTSPQVASVGLTRTVAQAAGRAIREVTAPVATLGARLRADGYEDGWAQWIVDANTNRLLGATFVGDNVAELLHASTVAIVGGLTVGQLAHAVPPFPTMSEVYLNLQEALGL